MNKTIKYSINGALWCGIINGIINALNQKDKQAPNERFNWNEFFKAFGNGALLGGAGGLVIGAVRDDEMTEALICAGGTAGFIKRTLENNSDTDTSRLIKAEKIRNKLYVAFGDLLCEYPSLSGSVKKGTAIARSDIDVVVKFNKNAGTIEDIRNLTEDYLTNKYCDKRLTKVRNQNHSIGLFFKLYGEIKRIDVVPMREIENGKGDSFLYSSFDARIIKTNSTKQNKVLNFTAKEKRIIMLLKSWKIENQIDMPSVFIEHIVKRAFNERHVPRRLDNALLIVIEYLANKITKIRIVDPANTNNIISDSLSGNEKETIQNFCLTMLDNIEKDERNILDYFPAQLI
jgi:hypothetical protein